MELERGLDTHGFWALRKPQHPKLRAAICPQIKPGWLRITRCALRHAEHHRPPRIWVSRACAPCLGHNSIPWHREASWISLGVTPECLWVILLIHNTAEPSEHHPLFISKHIQEGYWVPSRKLCGQFRFRMWRSELEEEHYQTKRKPHPAVTWWMALTLVKMTGCTLK